MLSKNEELIKQELLKLMKHFQCPICLNLMSNPMVTRCVHHFCGQCINKAIESSSGEYCRCPLCNEKITKRSLRPQLDIFDIIESFKASVDSFENDNQMSLITDCDEVVVFDVSSDKSKSCVESNESIDKINDFSKSVKTNEKSDQNSDIESNRKTTTIALSDESLNGELIGDHIIDIKDLEETDIYFETNEESDDSKDTFKPETEHNVEPLPTQSQNLKVNKSRITYSSSRPPTDDRFDRIIRLSEITSNLNQKQSKDKTKQKDQQKNSQMESHRRKPLTQLNKNENKRRMKRVVISDSSDDEFIPQIVTKETQMKKREQTNGVNNEKVECLPYEDKSEDLFLPAVNSNNDCIESIRGNDLSRDESKDSFNSDIQSITCSQFSDF